MPSDGTIRVLHLDTGQEWRGGQQQVLYLSRELTARGHTSVIVVPKKSPLARRAQEERLAVREITCHGAGDPMAIRGILQAVQETGAELIHAHTANAHSLCFILQRLPGIPKDLKPAVVVHRRVDFPPATDPLTRMRYTGEPALYLCVSEAVRLVLERYGVDASRLRVVHSATDIARIDAHAGGDRLQLKEELGVPAGAPLIGAVGALVPHKGHRYLLAAMPKILGASPDAHAVLFGDGPLEAELRRECWDRGLHSRFLFAGFRSDVARFLPCFDLFAHPSTEEGLGTTILDAMAARLPVVATRAGGIPEAVRHGETGWLVPPEAPSELAGSIISLLQDPRRRARFGEAGRARVEAEFSIEGLCNSVTSAYSETLGGRPLSLASGAKKNL